MTLHPDGEIVYPITCEDCNKIWHIPVSEYIKIMRDKEDYLCPECREWNSLTKIQKEE